MLVRTFQNQFGRGRPTRGWRREPGIGQKALIGQAFEERDDVGVLSG